MYVDEAIGPPPLQGNKNKVEAMPPSQNKNPLATQGQRHTRGDNHTTPPLFFGEKKSLFLVYKFGYGFHWRL